MDYKLFKFSWESYYAMIEGLFICTQAELDNIIGKELYLGEAEGKHSETYGTLEKDDIEEIKVSLKTIAELLDYKGKTICGYNPFDYVEED